MIAIRINKLFSRLGRGFYSFAGLSNSEETESSKQMRLFREMAVWSCKVIYTIKEAKPDNNRDIEEPSLREQILNLSIQGFQYSQESKNAVLKMFMEGILLNKTVYNQTRILFARQESSERPFIFCPNMLVTRAMFRILMTRDFNLMTLGEYGISKTISIMLFHILSSIVNQYKYSAFSDSQEKIYYQELMRKGLIFDVPKFFYWSMRQVVTDQQNIQEYIKDIILQQATQLSKEEKEQLIKNSPNLKRLAFNLQKLYNNKQITTKVVIDQLNILASLMRKWNIFCAQSKKQEKEQKRDLLKLKEDLENEIEKNKKQQLTQELKKEKKKFDSWKISQDKIKAAQQINTKDPALRLLKLMRSYQNLAQVSIYNSSINIEKQLLEKYKGISVDNLSLQLEQEGRLWLQQIRFNQNIKEKWGRNDFYHYFWFEIQKRLSAKQFSLQSLQNLKLVFYHKVKDTNIPGYYRFLNIRELFEQKASLLNFTKEFTDEQMSDKIGQIIYALKLYSLDCCRQKIERFVKKLQQDSKQMKRNYTRMLNKMAEKQIQQENGDKYMTTTLDEIDNKYLGAGRGKARKFINSKAFDKEFIQPIISSNNQSVTFPWTANEYLEINQIDIVKQQLNLTTIQALQYHIKANDDIGKEFEKYLIKVLQQPQTVVKFFDYISKGNTRSRSSTIDGQSTFLSFKGDALNFNINFSQLIKLARQKPGNYFLGLPFKCIQKQKGKEKEKTKLWLVDENNPTTDFVIFSCEKKKKKPLRFFLESFDATVTLKEDTLEEKTEKAKQLFVKMIENPRNKSQFTEAEKERYFDKEIEGNLQFTVTHTILCRKALAKNREPIIVQLKNKQTLTINFMAIEDFQIQYCREPFALQMFNKFKAFGLRFLKEDYKTTTLPEK